MIDYPIFISLISVFFSFGLSIFNTDVWLFLSGILKWLTFMSFFVFVDYSPINVKLVSNFFSLLLSIDPLRPTFIDLVCWNGSSIKFNPKLFEALPNVSFLSSARLSPKPKLFVVTFSPNPVADSFLFSGGRMFRIDV
jgi:hypothetical protein